MKDGKGLKEFFKKKLELLKKYSTKDAEGAPMIKNGKLFVDKKFLYVFNAVYDELAEIDIKIDFN